MTQTSTISFLEYVSFGTSASPDGVGVGSKQLDTIRMGRPLLEEVGPVFRSSAWWHVMGRRRTQKRSGSAEEFGQEHAESLIQGRVFPNNQGNRIFSSEVALKSLELR